jgi:hypothetical protein
MVLQVIRMKKPKTLVYTVNSFSCKTLIADALKYAATYSMQSQEVHETDRCECFRRSTFCFGIWALPFFCTRSADCCDRMISDRDTRLLTLLDLCVSGKPFLQTGSGVGLCACRWRCYPGSNLPGFPWLCSSSNLHSDVIKSFFELTQGA